MDNPLKSVSHGQCDVMQTYDYLPAAGHHRTLTGTKLYCLVTEAHNANNLPKVVNFRRERAI